MTAQREIPRYPVVPELSPAAVSALTRLCFGVSVPLPRTIDMLFVFGSTHGIDLLTKAVENVLAHCKANSLVIAGGMPHDKTLDQPEAVTIAAALQHIIPSTTNVILEKTSRNSYDNVAFSMKLIEELPKVLAFVSKNYHCGRAKLTLQRFLPNTDLYQAPYGFMPQNSWTENVEYRSRVWGEYLRIHHYGARGDITYPPDVAALVEDIQKLTNKVEVQPCPKF